MVERTDYLTFSIEHQNVAILLVESGYPFIGKVDNLAIEQYIIRCFQWNILNSSYFL